MGFTNSASAVAIFARDRMANRALDMQKEANVSDIKTMLDAEAGNGVPVKRDFLSRFLEAHKKDPSFIGEDRVLALTVANMFAGSDTTAITLLAVFYYLVKHPQTCRA
ncbi:hypothetical protein ABVK25_012408 [Lepraria finkii]|uniref:Cytochrome P450 n=1 Tax=Lepraria finkii TaxID=1340010 RepID=A0ABR4AM65_9LECA